ncbi:hypothetical protein OP10G_1475 [Fimbriimonas ginsengisoli Gsoil 348]|uniref:Uncharacterized protein n=1 Tax=Fimbriimonas ginsengisoli Gsoil 348 TaxID=661478 RepID=A0A068NMP8_FIMGI|nr:hypothetical protein OP10G_1475 [Fimbriimonas ginsengisoli Gsoil 348]
MRAQKLRKLRYSWIKHETRIPARGIAIRYGLFRVWGGACGLLAKEWSVIRTGHHPVLCWR